MANREDSVALAHRRLGHKLYAVNDSVHLARKRLGIPEPPPAQQSTPEHDQLKKESPGVRGAHRLSSGGLWEGLISTPMSAGSKNCGETSARGPVGLSQAFQRKLYLCFEVVTGEQTSSCACCSASVVLLRTIAVPWIRHVQCVASKGTVPRAAGHD